ncbi:MAG: electron transfer flavoprotein subunit beta/FixA family protein [Dehalococcoidia bacterium]|nr:electron transfer flavoprotein subunit beta/FixA family protein [Dehalococcoidia bacterium]
MQIVVCVKQVLDPEMPRSAFKVDPEGKRVIPPKGTPPVISPFDENALEAALRLKDRHGGRVTVISAGNMLAQAVLRKTLAAGADELILLEDPSFQDLDSFATAGVLASAIRRIGDVQLVFTGRQAADWDAGITGCVLAEELGIPCITVARKVEISDGGAIVEREASDGSEIIETPLPCVITADSPLGELRPVTLPGLTAARKKPLHVWRAADLDLWPSPPRCHLVDLYVPKHETVCEMIDGNTPEEAAVRLAGRLHEAGFL